MFVLGIDPGLQGAWALIDLDTGKLFACGKVSVVKSKKGKTEYNLPAMRDLLNNSLIKGVALELVHSMPGQGVASMFAMGRGLGLWEGMIVAMNLPYVKVAPRTWQKEILTDFNKGDEAKQASILNAERIFPYFSFKPTERCTKIDHNMTDAANLALYAKKIFG